MIIAFGMSITNRQLPRYRDFARARVTELSCMPGVIEDVSRGGCKVRFSHSIEIDSEREYSLTVHPCPGSGFTEFELVVRPQWSEVTEDSTEIGFTVLHSPGIRDFHRYVALLSEQEETALQEA